MDGVGVSIAEVITFNFLIKCLKFAFVVFRVYLGYYGPLSFTGGRGYRDRWVHGTSASRLPLFDWFRLGKNVPNSMANSSPKKRITMSRSTNLRVTIRQWIH